MRYFFLEAAVSDLGESIHNSDETEHEYKVISSGYYKTEKSFREVLEGLKTGLNDCWSIESTIFSDTYAEIVFCLLFDSPSTVFEKTRELKKVHQMDLPRDLKKDKAQYYISIDVAYNELDINKIKDSIYLEFPDTNIIIHELEYEKGASSWFLDFFIDLTEVLEKIGGIYGGVEVFKALYKKIKSISKESKVAIKIQDEGVKQQIEKHLIQEFGGSFIQLGCFLSSDNQLVCEYLISNSEDRYVVFYNFKDGVITESVRIEA